MNEAEPSPSPKHRLKQHPPELVGPIFVMTYRVSALVNSWNNISPHSARLHRHTVQKMPRDLSHILGAQLRASSSEKYSPCGKLHQQHQISGGRPPQLQVSVTNPYLHLEPSFSN